MLTLNRNQQRMPIGGHQYPEEGLTITGESYDEVVKKLTEFRLSNGRPVGSPRMDVLRHYAKLWPYMVIDDGKTGLEAPISEIYPIWRAWINRQWSNPGQSLLSKKEASLRWEKCKDCPMNSAKSWKPTDESKEMDKRAFLMRQGIDVPSYIGFCTCHKADAGVLSFLEKPKQASQKDEASQQPVECWVI